MNLALFVNRPTLDMTMPIISNSTDTSEGGGSMDGSTVIVLFVTPAPTDCSWRNLT